MFIDNIELPDGRLEYKNPFEPSVSQSIQHTTNGAAVISRSTKQAGVSVVLESGSSGFERSKVNALDAHAKAIPDSFDITLQNGDVLTVVWDYTSSPIEAEPLVRDDSTPDTQLMTNIVLRFLTV